MIDWKKLKSKELLEKCMLSELCICEINIDEKRLGVQNDKRGRE